MKRFLSILFLLSLPAIIQAQFFQGWGIMAGGTLGRQKWKWVDPAAKDKSKYLLRYNGEVFAEFFDNPTYRWVTELQYNVKGAKWKSIPGSSGGSTTLTEQNQYIAWNNYLMIRQELVSIIPYAKVGPRLEYVFSSPQSFSKIHVCPAAGVGVEFVAFGPVALITEAWWVPDVLHSYKDSNLTIKQHCWELRVGIKFSPGGESCPKVYK
ncbi:MAG: hypothetical protein HY064_15585 [Bacteroidetes bacterium]|nr:hypothetical protein [Bacteroidota bacterium]